MALTPMMQQYFTVKEKAKDCILFFRLGDFYEMFFEDAEVASRELELVLTGRDCGLSERAPMCGVPFHSATTYISRLINKGFKVAICEQVEDVSASKGIVKRDIVQILTPGTFMDSNYLEQNKNNFILSIYKENDKTSLCFADVSTGECYVTAFNYSINFIMDEIAKYMPSEIIMQHSLKDSVVDKIKGSLNTTFTFEEDDFYLNNVDSNIENFKSFIEKEYNFDILKKSVNGMLNYIVETQKMTLSNIVNVEYYSINDFMTIDINSRRNLELVENTREKTKRASLLWVLDNTQTSMGSRMLKKWVEQPLKDSSEIQKRLQAVEELTENISLLEDLKAELKGIYDIERIVGKVATKSVNAKELVSLKASTQKIPNIKNKLKNTNSNLLKKLYLEIDELKDIYNLIETSIIDSPSLSVKDGNIIKDSFNNEVDELRIAKTNGKEWIANLENEERAFTGIKSLKVGYNKVFGYYIEITRANYDLIPEGRYIRKQTLANAERFITEDLKNIEEKILGAEEKLNVLEYNLFTEIRDEVEKNIERLKATANKISYIDCLISLATIALDNNYIKPSINEEGIIDIKDGRHPVVEKMIPSGDFVSNNTFMNRLDHQMLLITGPNMAGKSTYMRQIACIIIMTQIGSFVPASYANISICDKIFTRIGASDDLAGGQSTFMVEMSEVSNILENATRNSLIILDEVGRGTSTYDGLSIAWAVIDYICSNENLKCNTLFSTHYHELTKLEDSIPSLKNYSISVKEIGNEVVFLRKIIKGGADQSYGIEVAKIAGLPPKVVDRAKEILESLEKQGSYIEELPKTSIINETTEKVNYNIEKEICASSESITTSSEVLEISETIIEKNTKSKSKKIDPMQMSILDYQKDDFISEISKIDILNKTPIDAFNILYEIINKAKSVN